MPNPIKYSTTGDTLSIKAGNFYFGTGDFGKGPSLSTRYYNGVSPASNSYTVYSYNANQSSNISFYGSTNDSELITYTNLISGQNFSTATQCLNWYVTQTNYVCINRDYEGIVTSGLTLCLDAGFTSSYTSSGTTWYDLSYNGLNNTLFNGPTFSSFNGGGIVFDGTDDYSHVGASTILDITGNVTVCSWVKPSLFTNQGNITAKNGNAGYRMRFQSNGTFWLYANGNQITSPLSYSTNNWYHAVGVFSSTGLRMYINGSLVQSNANAFNPNFGSASNFYIGSLNTTLEKFNGTISIINVYNRALSATEILQNFNAQKSRFGL